MRTKIMTNEVVTSVMNFISEGKTVPEIATLLGINKVTISSFLRTHGIKLHPDKGNVHYFDSIDTYAKAYIVGFIAADGALVKTKTTTTLTITVKYEDKAVLEFIKSEIGNEHKLQEIIRPSSFDSSKNIHHIRYTISDRNITIALNKLGITSNKSLSMGNIIKNIPYEYRDAFIIGYFDGDGSVSFISNSINNKSMNIQIRGTQDCLSGICNHLDIPITYIHQYNSIPQLTITHMKYIVRFFECYQNLQFYYIRKHNKFLERINEPSYAKYKQVQTISSPTG